MEAVSVFETWVNFDETTRRNIPEDSRLHSRRRESLESHWLMLSNGLTSTREHVMSLLLCLKNNHMTLFVLSITSQACVLFTDVFMLSPSLRMIDEEGGVLKPDIDWCRMTRAPLSPDPHPQFSASQGHLNAPLLCGGSTNANRTQNLISLLCAVLLRTHAQPSKTRALLFQRKSAL
jgi:hypothetical protein